MHVRSHPDSEGRKDNSLREKMSGTHLKGRELYLTEVEGLVQATAPARAADHRQRGVRLPGDAALLEGPGSPEL